ncbi:DUF1440 domain-containing protein, partial [Escherichia coli]|uniref:DUF1440 domain-containing protein n=2 Tax=Escherichia coli TaxID=562 RepID=UPI0021D49FA3
SDGNGSHASTSKTPSYTKSVSWQHHRVVAEVFPKIKLWQGLLAGALAQLFVHMISFPLMGLTPPLFDLPWYENLSEIFGHLVWFWSIEIIRRDLRNRITHEPDPEIPLGSNR